MGAPIDCKVHFDMVTDFTGAPIDRLVCTTAQHSDIGIHVKGAPLHRLVHTLHSKNCHRLQGCSCEESVTQSQCALCKGVALKR